MMSVMPLGAAHPARVVPFLVIGLVWVVFGSLNAANPQLSWKMRRWRYRNKEAMAPSDAALRVNRIGGILVAVAGLVMIVVSIVHLS